MLVLRMRDASIPSTPLLLCKGQRWNMADRELRIYRVGLRLVEFRVFKAPNASSRQQLGPSSLETVGAVQAYLRKHQAVLRPTA
jgi:hypothetical protein